MANTISGLTVSVLRDAAITKLSSVLAPLFAYTRDFGAEPLAPGRTVIVPLTSAAADKFLENGIGNSAPETALGVDFEQTHTTMAPVSIPVVQITKPFGITQKDLNEGIRLQQLAEANANAFAEIISDKITKLFIVANYPNPLVAPTVAGWGTAGAGIKAVYKRIATARSKYAILDPTLYAETMFTQAMSFVLGGTGGTSGVPTGAPAYGFTGIYPQSRWTGTAAGTLGFACDPQAVAIASGPPVSPPEVGGTPFLIQESFTVPQIGMTCVLYMWLSTKTRSLWASYDVMFGAAVGDATAGAVIIPKP